MPRVAELNKPHMKAKRTYHAKKKAVAKRAAEALQLFPSDVALEAPPLDSACVLRSHCRSCMVRVRLRMQPAQHATEPTSQHADA